MMTRTVLSVALTLMGAVGWRTDGTGRYPDAEPPVKWSAETNVVWKTPMPSWSNATPIIVGDKLFVCSEPDELVCVNLADGKILWRRPNGYEQVFPADEMAEIREKAAKAEVINKKLRGAQGKLWKAKKKLKKAPEDADLKKQVETRNAEVKAITKEFEPLKEHMTPATNKVNGYSSHTPVSDGKHVWVATGFGTVACYDLAGERKWIRLIQKPVHNWGNSTSPVLADGKLIVHFQDMIGLDPATGDEAWRTKSKINGLWGTPAVTKVDGVELIISATGDVVRASDGKKLTKRKISKLDYGSPVVLDGVAYFVQEGSGAVKLPEKVGEKFTCEELWRLPKKPKTDIRHYASSLVHDGLVYAITRKRVLSVLDAASGDKVYSKRLKLGGGEVYSSITLAGKYVYISIDSGRTIVMEPGREYKEVAVNQLETFRSCPVFAGKRMYIRGYKHLYCIGK